MLNQINRLQVVLEIITNEISTTLELLAQQQSQMRAAIYQNRIVEEGEACGKFYQTDCCIQIGVNGEVLTGITKNIRKISHVLVQTVFLLKTITGIVIVILTNVCLFPASYPS